MTSISEVARVLIIKPFVYSEKWREMGHWAAKKQIGHR
jgi:hypothetical protein